MKLYEILDRFSNEDFLISVNGWCSEMSFSEYQAQKEYVYWDDFKDKEVISMSILSTNGSPELCVKIEE